MKLKIPENKRYKLLKSQIKKNYLQKLDKIVEEHQIKYPTKTMSIKELDKYLFT